MTYRSIRKNDSLGNSAARLRNDMKEAHNNYSDYVSELAMLTKSELRPIVSLLKGDEKPNGPLKNIDNIFDKIQSVLYGMDEINLEMGEIIQVIGGLEFSTNNTVDKLAEILSNQEKQQSRMFTELTHLRESMGVYKENDITKLKDFKDDINEYQVAFSVFQDRIIETIPRINNVFDELDREEEAGLKYGTTKQI